MNQTPPFPAFGSGSVARRSAVAAGAPFVLTALFCSAMACGGRAPAGDGVAGNTGGSGGAPATASGGQPGSGGGGTSGIGVGLGGTIGAGQGGISGNGGMAGGGGQSAPDGGDAAGPARDALAAGDTDVPPAAGTSCAKGAAPPAMLNDWISTHALPLSRLAFDAHVAIYGDQDVNPQQAAWVTMFMSQAFQYTKSIYDPVTKYGPDCLYVFLHQGRFGGGTISNYFDGFATFRNATDVGAGNWVRGTNIDLLSHEMAHIVEGASNGTHESPAFGVWGDSKWAEIFQYDLYVALGLTADATRVFDKFTATVDTFPRAGTRWFRDWFHPLWRDHGKAPTLAKFFQLLAQHFPKRMENQGRNPIFTRRMNLGEFVHFYSGAAGKDLTALATTAFGAAAFMTQLAQARTDFAGVTY